MEFFRQSTELKRRGYRGELQTDAQAAKIVELTGIYLRPHFNTSEPHPEHEKFPYLLHKCKIERLNQVWSTDITYTVVDSHRTFVLGIVVVNTIDAFHCVKILEMTVNSYEELEIFNIKEYVCRNSTSGYSIM